MIGSPEVVHAVALDAHTRRRILDAPADAGSVHSVFARAVNLAWHDGHLVTLHGPGALRAPFAVAVERFVALAGLEPGQPVAHRDARLAVAGVIVDVGAGGLRDVTLRQVSTSPAALARALTGAPAGAAGRSLAGPRGCEARMQLRAGIRSGDADSLRRGAHGLIGFGEGLTPAGDDCLVGVLAVLHAFRPEIIGALRGAVVEAAQQTTFVAREFLLAALDGRFGEPVVHLCSTAPSEVPTAAAELLALGATSGADTLLGVRDALTALEAAAIHEGEPQ